MWKNKKRWCPQWKIMCYAKCCSELSLYHPKDKCLMWNKEEDKKRINKMKDKVICVTGSNGFIIYKLVQYLGGGLGLLWG